MMRISIRIMLGLTTLAILPRTATATTEPTMPMMKAVITPAKFHSALLEFLGGK